MDSFSYSDDDIFKGNLIGGLILIFIVLYFCFTCFCLCCCFKQSDQVREQERLRQESCRFDEGMP